MPRRAVIIAAERIAILAFALGGCSTVMAQTASVSGKWQRQVWAGIPGDKVAALTASPEFHQIPDSTTLVDSSYASVGDNYGARTRGYITPTTTGLYTFWVAGDDETRLLLSKNAGRWSARQIAGSPTYTSVKSWDQSYSQRSVPQYLEAGQSYYVELLQKDSGGPDHASVAWSAQPVDTSSMQNWASLAKGAVASASSTYSSPYPPSAAIDGNPTTFSHTGNDTNAWWMVDFRQDRPVSFIELVNRPGNQSRLSNFRVTAEDANGVVVASRDFYPTQGSVGASETWNLSATVVARRVKVQFLGPNRDQNYYLHMAEVKVVGPDVALKNWARETSALASASSTYSTSYPASNLIDGNTSTINHTSDTAGSWVEVDLGTDRLLDFVELINRPDLQNRLSNFRLSILDGSGAVVTSKDYYPTTGNVQAVLRWDLPQAVAGRKVKVESLGLNRDGNYFLHLAEIQAWGRADSAIPAPAIRNVIPSGVMSSYEPSLTDDVDDDGVPADLELANGLNPLDSSDGPADFDNDGISNIDEIRASANPHLWDSVPGLLVSEIWHHVEGDSLTTDGYKAAFTRDPDHRETLTTSEAFAQGTQYVRRVRGYITAPTTGAYTFWGAADSDVDVFLSTTPSKFDRKLILDDKVFTPIYSYDVDISQKSRPVTLIAGQKYYFEMWHKEGIGGSYFSVAWKTPNGTRELIPSKFLSSYGGESNDQDDDYLKDDYELASGLSTTDNGHGSASTNGFYGDFDGDGLSNGEEQKLNTKANLADSDADGVSDFDEANFFGSATLANDIGAFTPVVNLAGDAYSASSGEWQKSGDRALQRCRRGSVTYPVTVPVSGVHALKFTIGSIAGGAYSEQYDFDLKLNGKRIAYKTLNILPDGTATLAILSPWLNAGEIYDLELFVDNSYNFRRVSIDHLQILAAGGTDSNDNGTPDWVDIRVHNTNGFDSTAILSKTSPATVEGNARLFEFLNPRAALVTQAPNGRFFTEVALTPGAASTLEFSFENGAVNQAATVEWLPTNLLLENNLTLRQGDSLLLTAFQNAENASLENYSITAGGQTYIQTADQPTPVPFATPGTTSIQLTHTGADAVVTSRTVTVTVLPRMSIVSPVCIVGYPRTWTHPALPAGAILQFDDHIARWQESAANTYTLATATPLNQTVCVRQGVNGPILGKFEVKSASVRSSDQTGCLEVSNSQNIGIVELPIVVFGDIGDASVKCEIIIGGVTYLDGSTTKTLSGSEFGEFGTKVLQFKVPNSAHSNCHRFSIYQGNVKVSQFN